MFFLGGGGGANTWQELTISLPISKYSFNPDSSSKVYIGLKFKGHWKIKYFEVNNSTHISRQQLPDTQLLFLLDIDGLCVRQHVTLLCTEVWLWPRNNYYNVTYFRPVHKKRRMQSCESSTWMILTLFIVAGWKACPALQNARSHSERFISQGKENRHCFVNL